ERGIVNGFGRVVEGGVLAQIKGLGIERKRTAQAAIDQPLYRDLLLASQALDVEIVGTRRCGRAHGGGGVTLLTEGRAIGQHARRAAVELGDGRLERSQRRAQRTERVALSLVA